MKNIQITSKAKMVSVSILAGLFFTACGGGGGDSASFENTETLIDINIACVTTPTATDISSYITLESGDVIVKDTTNAEISIYHDADGNKKVCLVTPSAHIVRQ